MTQIATPARHGPHTARRLQAEPRLQGLLAEYPSPGAMINAAEKIRDAGFTAWDTHSPFPVHGIDSAMGIRRTRLPFIVFGFGVVGCLLGLGLQLWTNATNLSDFPWVPNFVSGYNFQVSGKPDASLPAFIPVTFELTVLLSAFAAVFGMLAMNNLPWHHDPRFSIERFKRVTADRFFAYLSARDPKFSPDRARALLESTGAVAIDSVYDEPASPSQLPRAWRVAAMILLTFAILPPLWIARARSSTSEKPRIHPIQDMDNQEERYKTQQASTLFADGRSMRTQVPGTVSRGDWPRDAHFHDGRQADGFATTFPPQVQVDEALVRRGQQRFAIYCAPCHGLDGSGNGIVNVRAQRLLTEGWVQPTAMTDDLVVNRPVGHIFNTITHGIRSMPPYGDQITPADRWAIVAYVRALEFSQRAPVNEVPADLRPKMPQR